MSEDSHARDASSDRTPTEARQAVETGHMRYILAISLVAAVLSLTAAWLLL